MSNPMLIWKIVIKILQLVMLLSLFVVQKNLNLHNLLDLWWRAVTFINVFLVSSSMIVR